MRRAIAAQTMPVRYRGWAGHIHEVGRIYAAAQVNLDIGRIYQQDIVTMRVFDALASGGFVLAERSPDLERLFEVGVEVEAYTDLEELVDKVGFYLTHPERAREIAARGRAAVERRHSIEARVLEMLAPLAPTIAPPTARCEARRGPPPPR